MVSLAQIMVDPFYRTFDGFEVLIKKEWLAYGYKFASRAGLNDSLGHEQAPIFIQFLDAVFQLMDQFPLEFEFNEHYLATFVHHSCSMRFGTFLHDDEKTREAMSKEATTNSFWSFVDYCNERSPQVSSVRSGCVS